jgi:flagellar basal-body rod protein FlgB
MLISDLASAGALPVLEASYRFAAARHRVLVHNIANLDTPDFRPLDVSVTDFQAALSRAVEQRRARGPGAGPLTLQPTRELEPTPDGGLRVTPKSPSGGVLYHDRNNRDLERMMQDLAENVMAFRLAGDLIRRESDLLRVAISQRV